VGGFYYIFESTSNMRSERMTGNVILPVHTGTRI
jgi:hypothetical protein